ncbi:MAG: HAD-IIIC family phosphatase [Phyllobacteriaceae bacterium]|nr:HAD-IIIC family phosphatase [Phyllobacteriaceae bacterium]
MRESPRLHWLPARPEDWRARLKAVAGAPADAEAWAELVRLARHDLDFAATNALAGVMGRLFPAGDPPSATTRPERLAVMSSSTTTHLLPSLVVGALRRGIPLVAHENDYGLYRNELIEADGPLAAFRPTSVLFALDARHLTRAAADCRTAAETEAALERTLDDLAGLWRRARERFGAKVLQQTPVACLPATAGSNEHRNPASAAAFAARLAARLRERADAEGVDLVAVDERIGRDGLAAWHDPAFWFKAKQEIALPAAPMWGDLVARVLAARQGCVGKCLVLDLDNTLWGGVVGDEGPLGVVIGEGSTLGEAFLSIQAYAADLRRRGILLAVCSKNDDAVARAVFRDNPDMLLKESDVSCFIADWTDKATNLREIARRLNIAVDSLVFLDDNPFERGLVRRELPSVFVPELPDAPEGYVTALADSGCFEAVALTEEDFARASYYRADRPSLDVAVEATDLDAHLAELDMVMSWGRVDEGTLTRTAQLINKTNQFNLTTRRHGEDEVRAMVADPDTLALWFRLADRYGDNGLIAVVIARRDALESETFEIDTWLMSCRVLGRRVEQATLEALIAATRAAGGRRLIGVYRPTAKNGMVRDHYARLGFETIADGDDEVRGRLELDRFVSASPPIDIREVVR